MATMDDSKLVKLENHISAAKENVQQLLKGKKVASTRARSALLSITKLASELRKDILAYSKSMPTKKRAPKKTQNGTPLKAEAKQPDTEEHV
jgi:hypothetical protein